MLSAAIACICAAIFFYLLLCNVLLFRRYGLTGVDLMRAGYSGSIIFIALSVLWLSRLSVMLLFPALLRAKLCVSVVDGMRLNCWIMRIVLCFRPIQAFSGIYAVLHAIICFGSYIKLFYTTFVHYYSLTVSPYLSVIARFYDLYNLHQ